MMRDERVRFLVIGGINTVAGYAAFVVIQWLAGHLVGYVGSVILAHLLSSVLAFALYRTYVFKVSGHVLMDFIRFQSVYLVPLLANVLVLPVLVIALHLNVYVAQAFIVIVSACLSFLGHKHVSFRRVATREVWGAREQNDEEERSGQQ